MSHPILLHSAEQARRDELVRVAARRASRRRLRRLVVRDR